MDFFDFKSAALRTIANITYGKLKKGFLHSCILNILFIYIEQLSKMKIYSQLFFKDFVDRFKTTYLKNGFL